VRSSPIRPFLSPYCAHSLMVGGLIGRELGEEGAGGAVEKLGQAALEVPQDPVALHVAELPSVRVEEHTVLVQLLLARLRGSERRGLVD
jgi:hypothetical protein